MFSLFLRSLVISLALLVVGCSSNIPKQDVVYTSDWETKWKESKLLECRQQVVIITLNTFDSRVGTENEMSLEDVDKLSKWLMDGCIKFYKLDI
jgi:hypothetical protein